MNRYKKILSQNQKGQQLTIGLLENGSLSMNRVCMMNLSLGLKKKRVKIFKLPGGGKEVQNPLLEKHLLRVKKECKEGNM